MLSKFWLTVLATTAVALSAGADARQLRKAELHARQAEAAKRFRPNHTLQDRATSPKVKNITFSNPKASRELPFIYSAWFFVL